MRFPQNVLWKERRPLPLPDDGKRLTGGLWPEFWAILALVGIVLLMMVAAEIGFRMEDRYEQQQGEIHDR